jgi:16S rRNA (cytosine967-C5)-methyltransferase
VLVYSTCTISPAENERQIADFIDRHPDFQLDDLAEAMPDFAMTAACADERARAVARRSLLTTPHRHGTAGFFIARLRKE